MFKKYHWIEFCPAINVRGEMITLGDLPNKRTHHGVDKPMFISRYMFDRPGLPPLGPVLSPFYMDFDSDENPHHALMELLDAAERFIEMGVDEDNMKVRFTGGKGGSLEIPFQCFDAKPSRELPQMWRHIAEWVKSTYHYKTLDLAVYDRRRLWRLTNSRHRSGYFKIPLSLDELRSRTMHQIRGLAENSRSYEWVDDKRIESFNVIPKLRALYKDAGKAVRKAKKKWTKRVSERSEEWDPSKIFPCVALIIENGIDARQFQRNPTAFNIAVSLNSLNAPDDVILELLLTFAQKCDPPLPESRYPELEHCIDMAKKHEYTTHCKTPVFEAHCVGQKNCWIFQKKSKEELPEEIVKEEFTPETIAEAEELLNRPQLIAYIGNEMMSDIFMERKTKLTLFMLQLGWQSVRMSGETSTGKSHITDRIMECFPKHWWLKYTGTTDKYIRHMPSAVQTIYFAEFAAVRAGGQQESTAEYDMKIIMSEGKLMTGVVEKEGGKIVTRRKEVTVRNFITTSTDVEMAPELRNRQWELSTDRTINIPFVRYRAGEMSKAPWERVNCERARAVLRCAVEIIERDAPEKWWVPFMDELVPIFEPLKHRTDIRRNIEKLHKFIIACAKLHYRNRPTITGPDGVVYGIALPEDFYHAWEIGDEAIMGTLTEMTNIMKERWSSCEDILTKDKKLNSHSLASVTGIDQSNAKKWLTRFENMGLIVATTRESSGVSYVGTDDQTKKQATKEIKVEIRLSILYKCITGISSLEQDDDHIKRSSREFSEKKVVVLFPASIRLIAIDALPDDLRAKAGFRLSSISGGYMSAGQFRFWRDVQ